MFHEDNKKKTELERLQQVLSFEEILEESDLTEEEVLSVLYDLGYLRIPPFALDEDEPDETQSYT